MGVQEAARAVLSLPGPYVPRSLALAEPLERVLQRCHRDELLPLADALGIDARGLGLGDLSKAIAIAIRQAGSHAIASAVVRGGKSLAYEQILEDACRRRGIVYDGPEDAETALVRAWFTDRWDSLSTSERDAVWKDLGVGGAPPETGDQALRRADDVLGRSIGYALAQVANTFTGTAGLAVGALTVGVGPVGCLLRPFGAILAPLWFWYKLRPDEERVLAAIREVARLRQIVLHRVTIGVVGSPSTGKDAAIKALFGLDTGNISPIAGSTKEVSIAKLPGSTALFLVNTPGMGDVVEQVTEEAKQVLDHIDVYLYLVNAEGGVQAREKADHERCRKTGKPVLAIVNKVDVLRPRDKDKYLADARAKLDAPEEDFVAVAFDPLPQLSEGPINVEAVREWLVRRLGELGKDTRELPELPRPAPRAEGEPV